MQDPEGHPALHQSLSARLLLLTIAFVLIGEVLIYVPSISRYRKVYLEERLAAAHLATLAVEAANGGRVSRALERELLDHAGVLSVTLRHPTAELMLGGLGPVDKVFDMRQVSGLAMVGEAFETLWLGGKRAIRVIGASPQQPEVLVDVSLREDGLWREMIDYSGRILTLSIVISVITALSVYIALQLIIVGPLRRITNSVMAFRRRPEDVSVNLPGSSRSDEIGLVQNELGRMQRALRQALTQKTRLAGLGTAVSKINHDLRNILATAMVLSDRLDQSHDPETRNVTPRLLEALDRAARLCNATLNFARAETVTPRKTRFPLAPLVDEVGEAVIDPTTTAARWRNEVRSDITVSADRDQLFRALMNLGRNAIDATAAGGLISISAWEGADHLVVEVADTGTGVPETVRAHLFEPFSGSSRPGGTGLGLPIAREIIRAHGGDLDVAHTGEDGTAFRLILPLR